MLRHLDFVIIFFVANAVLPSLDFTVTFTKKSSGSLKICSTIFPVAFEPSSDPVKP